jgi:hypothetical protein
VSNARFCERLPDVRPDLYPHGTSTFDASTFLLADVEIEVLESGTIHGFIPTNGPTVASYDGRGRYPAVHAWGMPGENRLTSLEPLAGFTYRGTMVWEIPAGEGRVAVDVQQPGDGGDGSSATAFSFLVRDGTVGQAAPGTPQPTSDPAAIPTTGIARLGASIILEADRGTMPVVVDGIDQVPRYPGVAPAAAGDVFLELWLRFGPGSGTFAFDPAEWVVVGPTGAALGRLELPEPDTVPSGWPIFLHTLVPDSIPPGRVGQPTYLVVEAPADGRVTLEYRPAGGPALVTWVLRDRGGG